MRFHLVLAFENSSFQSIFTPLLVGWRRSLVGWRPLLVDSSKYSFYVWRPSLLGWLLSRPPRHEGVCQILHVTTQVFIRTRQNLRTSRGHPVQIGETTRGDELGARCRPIAPFVVRPGAPNVASLFLVAMSWGRLFMASCSVRSDALCYVRSVLRSYQ